MSLNTIPTIRHTIHMFATSSENIPCDARMDFGSCVLSDSIMASGGQHGEAS